MNRIEKPWGYEEILHEDAWRIKKIVVEEGKRTSLQYHREKFEAWFYPDGHIVVIPPLTDHRLEGPVEVIEAAMGSDDDIVRLEDDYGRT